MTQILITEARYSSELCNKNPNKLFVFGDNMIRRGKAGQAVIRDCDNAFGIVTKVLPSMSNQAFFSDNEKVHKMALMRDLESLDTQFNSGKWEYIVFPKAGIGTGLAKLKLKAPQLYLYLSDHLFIKYEVQQ